MKKNKNESSIRDNFSNGSVGDFLAENIISDSNLSFVTAYFTIFALITFYFPTICFSLQRR